MTIKPSVVDETMKKILSMGKYLLMAYFRDIDSVMKVMSQIPYAKIDGNILTSREGTVVQAVSNITLNDGSKGFVILTGGNINADERIRVADLLNEFGEDQTFVLPKD